MAVRYHLDHLNEEETKKYILHRLSIAGRIKPIFTQQAHQLIYVKSNGIPRRINRICDLALFSVFGKGVPVIDEDVIKDASSDLEG